MFNFFTTFDLENKTIVARNMHVRGDRFALLTASSDGIISSFSAVTMKQLVEAGIAVEQADGSYKLVKLSDDTAEAQAANWGTIAKQTWCACDLGCELDDMRRYERYDGHGEYTGLHGYACAKCKGIVQSG